MSNPFLNYRQAFEYPNSPIKRWHKFAPDVIPLWVADMDYPTAPSVVKAITTRLQEGRLGYVAPPPSLYSLVAEYCQHQYDWKISPDWIVFIPGVVPGLAASVLSATDLDSAVLVPRPVYAPFYEVVEIAKRRLIYLPFQVEIGRMVPNAETWKQADVQACRLLLWCNPHNPGGTVYSANENQAVLSWLKGDSQRVVVSDEIHADIGLSADYRHTPLARLDPKLSDQTITLMSPNKAFNIPSIGMAYAIIPSSSLRQRFQATISPWQHTNPVALEAVRVCLQEGQALLQPMLTKIRHNVDLLAQWAQRYPNRVELIRPEAGYLAWLKINNPPSKGWMVHFAEHGVGINGGELYRSSADWIRINIATDDSILKLALERMSIAISAAS